MIDERNAIVTPHVGADDTVISWSHPPQVAQNKLLNNVLVNLFSAEGSQVYLNPASDYLKLERGSRKGHSVIGSRRVDGDPTISSLCWRSMICPVCRPTVRFLFEALRLSTSPRSATSVS